MAIGLAGAAQAQSSETKGTVPSITVSGRALRDVVPDQALITVGVSTDRPTASDAAAQNIRTATALLDEIKATGIPDADVETVQASLTPVYDTDRSGASGTKVKGFHAANEVRIRVRNLAQVGPLVGRLLDKGANTLEGVDYAVANSGPVMDELRAEATRDARRKAQIYADAAGVKLGRILIIAPEGASPSDAHGGPHDEDAIHYGAGAGSDAGPGRLRKARSGGRRHVGTRAVE